MKHKKEKKEPSDYPLLSFRTNSKEEKEELEELISKVRDLFNENRDENDYRLYKKNTVALMALRMGIETLLKKRAWLKQ